MLLTREDVLVVLPRSVHVLGEYLTPLQVVIDKFGIDSPELVAAFLATIGHESAHLTRVEENLNYGVPGLLATFPKYFTTETASQYARQPEKIANRVYANRMGNGEEASGEGWLFRGRGLIQVTGRYNYWWIGKALGLPLLEHPELLIVPINAALSAGQFWHKHQLNAAFIEGGLRQVTRIVNGGLNGWDDRLSLFNAGMEVFA